MTVLASDVNGGETSAGFSIGVTDVNEAPAIGSNGGGTAASITIPENSTAVASLLAADPESGAIAWSISGGADPALFKINSATGILSFKTSPDYENRRDSAKNNVNNVTVQASDGSLSDSQALKVTVKNVAGISIAGDNRANVLTGTPEYNVLNGRSGNDVLRGSIGNNKLIDALGADDLYGGSEADKFVSAALSELRVKRLWPGHDLRLHICR